jgi:gluconolactonase
VFFDASPGYVKGIRCDTEGNVWAGFSGGKDQDGVAVFAPDGTLIGRILLRERCANLCFGGLKRNRLFMAASQSLYSLCVEAQGAVGG